MIITAYILASDPNWIEASILSYYEYVTKIVVSFDANSRSWTGNTSKTLECLSRIRAIDKDDKCVYLSEDYARLDEDITPIEKDTYQRTKAYEIAKVDADWVLQLDTDEICPDASHLTTLLHAATKSCANQLYYPFRWIYLRSLLGRFVEYGSCKTGAKVVYHGPIAIRGDLTHGEARRVFAPIYLVTCEGSVTSPYIREIRAGLFGPIVGETKIAYSQAIIHFSWVRKPSLLLRKFLNFGHANDRNWRRQQVLWFITFLFPELVTILTMCDKNPYGSKRFSKLPERVKHFVLKSGYEK